MTCQLTDRYTLALNLVMQHFGDKVRKADKTPYVGHLLRASGLVMEGGGTERAAIGGLNHDFLEDVDGAEAILLAHFGQDMVDLVAECSDTQVRPKPSWQERKEKHIAHLEEASEDALRILLADKLDNGRSLVTLANYAGKASVEQNFNSTPAQQIWYFQTVYEVIARQTVDFPGVAPQVDELGKVAEELAHYLG